VSWPAAEVRIDEGLVRSLLEEQHPDLADRPLRSVTAGFDNELWRLGEDLAVRMPRRAVAAALIENEQRWLPLLATRLPLRVPVPLRVGKPSAGYPWPWSIVPWIAGKPGDQVTPTDPDRAARQLGAFLRALHQPAPEQAPHNPLRGVPLSARTGIFEDKVVTLEEHVDGPGVRRVWEVALDADHHSGPSTWVHGDLHPGNLLIAGGALAAVLDFGDLCRGDPATDLAAIWLALPETSFGEFWPAYGQVNRALLDRSRGWAVLFGLMLLDLGIRGRRSYEKVGRTALDNCRIR
jgi:aminoglycoside phosphotransferase (APT) family kinase protein